MARRKSWSGEAALVTGGASGIGRAIARALAMHGAAVTVADIDEVGALEAADSLSRLPGAGALRGARLDVCDADAFADLAADVRRRHGHLDLLVNNAGTAVAGELQDLSLDHWRRVIDVNLMGVVNGIHAAYPAMVARGAGHIVNVASLAGLAPAPLMTPYATSKWAVVGLSRSLRAEAAGRGVGVTVVCPGAVETSLLDRTAPSGLPDPDSAPVVRDWVTRDAGRPCPAESVAADVLDAIAQDRAVVVTPRRARTIATAVRLAPGIADAMGARRVAQHRAATRG
jgi:NAD(P)-dependent dehydrogenase (short-subunit alcohol dehydrogenase family)